MGLDKFDLNITLDIFSRLPAESVLECKQVCKAWRNLLKDIDPYFAQMHLHRRCQLLLQQRVNDGHDEYANDSLKATSTDDFELGTILIHDGEFWYGKYEKNDGQYYRIFRMINHPPIRKEFKNWDLMIGSCNGLVCLCIPHEEIGDPVYICNPITGEYVYLPKFVKRKYAEGDAMMSGFGCHPSTNEYKVVRIYYPCYEKPLGQVQVYTLGTGTGWRDKGEIPCSFQDRQGILANGELHWLVDERKIVAFNLANEEFHFIASPPIYLSSHVRQLCVLGGWLSLVVGYEQVEIWLFKKKKSSGFNKDEQEYRNWSWSKEFTIAGEFIVPLALTKRGEFLFWKYFKFLCCYDPKTARLRILEKRLYDSKGLGSCQPIPHINSFVSLKALGESPAEE